MESNVSRKTAAIFKEFIKDPRIKAHISDALETDIQDKLTILLEDLSMPVSKSREVISDMRSLRKIKTLFM